MSAKQYIALQSVQIVDVEGTRRSIEPRVEGKVSGLFEHAFDAETEKRLLRLGAIREPEGTEEHEKPTVVETMHDSREADAAAASPKVDAAVAKAAADKVKADAAAAKAAADNAKAEADAAAAAKGTGDDLLKA